MATLKKHQLQLRISAIEKYASGLLHLVLESTDGSDIPAMEPGQFVEVAVDRANVLLNRPFSIYNYTPSSLELLVAPLGRASKALAEYSVGDVLRVIGPLGHGFRTDFAEGSKVLLLGGGVGIAPLYYQARVLKENGVDVEVVYGSRSITDPQISSRFAEVCPTYICTDDGSEGFHGVGVAHPAAKEGRYDFWQICGPLRMMQASAALATERGIPAEASLENKMACGLGACLCCVEPTTEGNICVCKDGPVFNIDKLKW